MFLTNLAAYYVGYKAVLNIERVGEIVYIPPKNVTKPIIKVDLFYIDLAREKNIKILKVFAEG